MKRSSPSTAFQEGKNAAWLSMWTLLAIGVVEISVSFYTGSLTLAADGLDSMADALISFIVWFGIFMIQKPRNKIFPYGYTKVESLAAFIAAVVVVILGSFIVYHAYERILHPVETINPEITLATLTGAGIISLHRAFRVRKIAKKYDLISLNLDAKNSIKDGSASFVGVASVILAEYAGIPYMDSVGSMIIAGYIFFMAYVALKESTLVLIDAVDEPWLSDRIKRYIEKNHKVNVINVLIRPLGNSFAVEANIKLNPDITLTETTRIVEEIQSSIVKTFKTATTLVIPHPASSSSDTN
ncbi:MAG TPA: cation diffusion facilitator family transporter [Nitrososphaeraceae archaeon]|nr:cation diffusion facilitator family transporter [Nitrososphaeraceae archaeon]